MGIYAAKSKEIGKVQVHLPALANIPPPVTEVMSISFSSGKPIYGVKTSSGVSAACFRAYFEASDAYRQRLENEIGYFAGKADTGNSQISQTVDKSDNLDDQILRITGVFVHHLSNFQQQIQRLKRSILSFLDHILTRPCTRVIRPMRRLGRSQCSYFMKRKKLSGYLVLRSVHPVVLSMAQ